MLNGAYFWQAGASSAICENIYTSVHSSRSRSLL